MSFGAKMLEARLDKSIPVVNLSRATGIPTDRLLEIERGDEMPDPRTVKKILAVLPIDLMAVGPVKDDRAGKTIAELRAQLKGAIEHQQCEIEMASDPMKLRSRRGFIPVYSYKYGQVALPGELGKIGNTRYFIK